MRNNMSVSEEVYRFIEEHQDLERISSTVLHGQMKWLKKDNVSSAIYKFYKEGRLELIDLEVKKNGVKESVYKITDKFNKPKRSFNKVYKQKSVGWRKKGNTKREEDIKRKKLIGTKKQKLVQRLEALSEVVLEVSIELENIK